MSCRTPVEAEDLEIIRAGGRLNWAGTKKGQKGA